ncbi:MAG: glycosyltransferase [Candidatus Obscuribacter sp.]|nr:glycosyltransferase [Candidatus Melainabacteria bacterium]MDX1989008.1 glycosyltransferase [Candidatus Obscuribacter sp.]
MSSSSPPSISLIVPAYNEEKRIGETVRALSAYLESRHPDSELLIVCDGCKDRTAEVARQSFVGQTIGFKVLEVVPNQGKGNAVREGMLAAGGQYLFFTDADLSFAPEVLEDFLQGLLDGADIVIAQRKKETQYPSLARRFIATGSRWLIGNLILPGIRDTQAGFKGFKSACAKDLFAVVKIKRFLFDLEVLLLGRTRGYRIEKVYVDWVDRPGSTVHVVYDTARSLRDLLLILFYLFTGQYGPGKKSKS